MTTYTFPPFTDVKVSLVEHILTRFGQCIIGFRYKALLANAFHQASFAEGVHARFASAINPIFFGVPHYLNVLIAQFHNILANA